LQNRLFKGIQGKKEQAFSACRASNFPERENNYIKAEVAVIEGVYSVEKQSFQRKYRPFFRGAFWDKHLEKRLESCGKNFSSEGKKVFPGKRV